MGFRFFFTLEKSSIRKNGSPLAPALPPLGVGAHAIPPHYLYGTFPTKLFSQNKK